ncbi:MAG: Nramp family divalent metal transporter [Alphaproteobacteria bacterium]|nr:Nramp family divalent metal transporter [Alphaproteobacteria bacterium]
MAVTAPDFVLAPRPAFAWRKLLAAMGPSYLIAVGYMDPGNWATDIAAGSRFGFALLSVVVFSCLAALFLQKLALKLGIASGRDLASLCRERYSPSLKVFLWITCEIAIVACDLAEVVGMAIALKLLFGFALIVGIGLTAVSTLALLTLEKAGFRRLQALVIVLVVVTGACFVYEIAASHPSPGELVAAFVPARRTLTDPYALYIALGIFGATVMPHNLYLQSALYRRQDFQDKREAVRFAGVDCTIALTFAALVNAAILITAASAFHWTGHSGVAGIEDAYRLLTPALGAGAASTLFAVALLAAGQNSTLTGTLAGQIVMEGFLGWSLDPRWRRLLTRTAALAPALAVVMIAGEGAVSQLLVLSQVVLSLQLGFAVVPLVRFTGERAIMGALVNGTATRWTGYTLAGTIVIANLWLVAWSVA